MNLRVQDKVKQSVSIWGLQSPQGILFAFLLSRCSTSDFRRVQTFRKVWLALRNMAGAMDYFILKLHDSYTTHRFCWLEWFVTISTIQIMAVYCKLSRSPMKKCNFISVFLGISLLAACACGDEKIEQAYLLSVVRAGERDALVLSYYSPSSDAPVQSISTRTLFL